MSSDTYFTLGKFIGAALLYKNAADLHRASGDAAVMSTAEAWPFNRALCKVAAAAYATDGDTTSPRAILFQNLAEAEEWSAGYDRFTDSVKRAMAKQAMILPILTATHDKLGGKMLRTLIAGGALGGAAAGSLGFLLSRNARQSSAENAELLEKVRAYKQLKRDIEEDMSANAVMEERKPARQRYNV